MFKITLSNVGLLTQSIPIIAEIIDEGVFKIDSNGISLVSPDRAMISVITVMPKEVTDKLRAAASGIIVW